MTLEMVLGPGAHGEPAERAQRLARFALAFVAALLSATVVSPVAADPPPPRARSAGKLDRKGSTDDEAPPSGPLLGTIVDTHSPSRVPLDESSPPQARFDGLLRDPVMGSVHPTDPRLLALVRALATRHPLARIEVVSGYRSPRLNEALRKKGHHVASHSQHSLGHALDFRLVNDGESLPVDPRQLAAEIRALGWNGGVGIYLGQNDRFVHADVGPARGWNGL